MRILYVTRNQNYSGFLILKKLIQDKVPLVGIILPNKFSFIDHSISSFFVKIFYKLVSQYQGNDQCKNLNSERLLAKKFNIPVYRIKSMNSEKFKELINKRKPDAIFLGGGWPELIPGWVIDNYQNSIFNTHPSLLPNFRGTSVTRWQIMKGVEFSGVTIHKVDKSFDTGDILLQEKFKIIPNQSPQNLFKSSSYIAAELVSYLFKKTKNLSYLKEIDEIKQIDFKASKNYYSKWSWQTNNLRIELNNNSLNNIERFIRANNQESYFYYGPHLVINDKPFFIRKSKIIKSDIAFSTKNPFEFSFHKLENCLVSKKGIEINSKDNSHTLVIFLIQKWDKFFKIRRAHHPKRFFRVGSSVKLKTTP